MSNSTYLLDTCTLINLLNRRVSVGDKIISVGSEHCAMSVISLYELYYGAYNAPEKYRATELQKISFLLKQFDVIPLPHTSDFAQIKKSLENAGEPIGDADVMIAATAIVHNMTLVTNNVKHFCRIGNIQVESW